MPESREITFAQMLLVIGERLAIGESQSMQYHIKERNGIVYLTIDGRKFATWGHYVYNEHHPLYGSKAAEVMASHVYDAMSKEEDDKFNEHFDRFSTHRGKLYERLFTAALKVLHTGGEEAMIKYIESFLDISENQDNCQGLLKEIEKQK